jgi:pilus assembly protein Flp/PilA
MSRLFNLGYALLARLRADEGQTMAEYGILIAVIAIVVVVAAALLGNSISSLFNHVVTDL